MNIYDKLCKPAKFYFVIATISYIFMILQNIGSNGRFTLGVYSCPHSNTGVILGMNAVYIVLWTWILNMICTINPKISWIIVLFPFILLFISLGLVLIQGIKKEGMCASCGLGLIGLRQGNGEMSQMTI